MSPDNAIVCTYLLGEFSVWHSAYVLRIVVFFGLQVSFYSPADNNPSFLIAVHLNGKQYSKKLF